MSQLNEVVGGFCFGVGIILAAALMRAVPHMQFC